MKISRKHVGTIFYFIFLVVTSLIGFIIFQIKNIPGIIDEYKMVLLCLIGILAIIFLTLVYTHKPISTRHILLGFLPLIISVFIVLWEDITVRPDTSKELTIEAHFMQYACGNWVDDMNVSKVGDTNYN